MRVPQSLRPRLSPSLLILYAIGACGASFPDTAMAAWLNPGGLGMSQARQTLLYATGFATFALKPAYGVLADAFARRLGAAASPRRRLGSPAAPRTARSGLRPSAGAVASLRRPTLAPAIGLRRARGPERRRVCARSRTRFG